MKKKIILISGPKRNIESGYWLYDFLIKDKYYIISFFLRKNDNENFKKLLSFFRTIKMIFYILFFAKKNDLILVYDNDTTGLYIGLIIHYLKPYLVIYKINCMANNKEKLYSSIKRYFVRKAYMHIYTTVNNQKIAELFSNFLKIDISHFIPIPDSLSDFGNDIIKIKDKKDNGYIFMGGATNRDYSLFLDVAKKMPNYNFMAVTFKNKKNLFKDAPKNVIVKFGLPENDFYQMIANSRIVFIPLTNNMQGGQMVIFQGALLEKPIVTTENTSIKTYFNDKSIKLIPMGDPESAIKTITELMEDSILRQKMAKVAYNQIIKFTTEEIYKQYKIKLFSLHNF